MAISISQTAEPGRFVNPRTIHTKTGDSKELVVLSGIVLAHFKGNSEARWLREHLLLIIDIAHIVPPSQAFFVEQAAPLVTLNAIFNQNVSHNAGYAVDSCSISGGPFFTAATVECDIAVRDTDGWLYRVGYYVTLVGRFGERPPV